MNSNRQLFFEGQQVYRATIIRHIRASFLQLFPDSWYGELRQTCGPAEWDKAKASAYTARDSGQIRDQIVDDFELIDITFFHNIFQKYWKELFPGVPTSAKQPILIWTNEVASFRHPTTGHPTTSDSNKHDTHRYLDSAMRVIDHIDPSAANEIKELLHQLEPEPNSPGSLLTEQRTIDAPTLPTREFIAPRFVGRQSELNDLQNWINDDDSDIWLLAGAGGTGKTAIAYQFATTLRHYPPPDLENIIWLSAKVRRFDSGRSVPIDSPDFHDLDSALDWILQASGADYEELDLKRKQDTCLEYLTVLPTLIVFDDVDTLDDRSDAMSFFMRNIRSTCSRILLTSRRIPAFFGPAVTHVQGLSEKDSMEFIKSRIEMFGLQSVQFTNKSRRRMVEVCDGSPLYLQDLMRLCKLGERPSRAINLWKGKKGQAAREYTLLRELEMLGQAAEKVLLACALYEGYISLDEIRVITELSDDDCHEAIGALQGQFLVPEPRLFEGTSRFRLNENTRRLVCEAKAASDDLHSYEMIIRSLRGGARATEFGELILRYRRRAHYHVARGEYEQAEELLLSALKRYPGSAELYGKLGWTYKSWQPHQRYTDARSAFTRAAELNSSNEDMYWQWWFMEHGRQEWTAATEAAEKGLTILPTSVSLLFAAGLARSQQARRLLLVNPERAGREARRAEVLLTKARVESVDRAASEIRIRQFFNRLYRAMLLNYLRLADIGLSLGDSQSADHYIRQAAEVIAHWTAHEADDPFLTKERESALRRYPVLVTLLK